MDHGKQVNGNWTLVVIVHENAIEGTLRGWKLKFAEGALNIKLSHKEPYFSGAFIITI